MSAGSIEYWPEPQRGITEAYRVTKPGGVACIIGPVHPTHPVSRWVLVFELMVCADVESVGFMASDLPSTCSCACALSTRVYGSPSFTLPPPPLPRLPSPGHSAVRRFFADCWMLFPTEEEYMQWFTRAGFKDVQITRIGPKWYRGVRRHGLIMGCSVTGVKPQVCVCVCREHQTVGTLCPHLNPPSSCLLHALAAGGCVGSGAGGGVFLAEGLLCLPAVPACTAGRGGVWQRAGPSQEAVCLLWC